MTDNALRVFHNPFLDKPSLVMGFSGWMDGGNVSTGTIDYLRIKVGALPFASIDPEGFYIMCVPGAMDQATLFRPRIQYAEGLVKEYDYPSGSFYVQPDYNLMLFSGKEPHLNWDLYAEAVLSLCERFGVQKILFIGSVAGLAPHSRDPRILCSMSRAELRPLIDKMGFHLSQYEGPAGFAGHLTHRAMQRQLDMLNLVAEIPVYLQGYNPKCIETMVRCISSILGLHLVCDELRALGEEYEKRVSELVGQQPDLAQRVEQLEESYDNEVFDTELDELKTWLHRRGIRLD